MRTVQDADVDRVSKYANLSDIADKDASDAREKYKLELEAARTAKAKQEYDSAVDEYRKKVIMALQRVVADLTSTMNVALAQVNIPQEIPKHSTISDLQDQVDAMVTRIDKLERISLREEERIADVNVIKNINTTYPSEIQQVFVELYTTLCKEFESEIVKYKENITMLHEIIKLHTEYIETKKVEIDRDEKIRIETTQKQRSYDDMIMVLQQKTTEITSYIEILSGLENVTVPKLRPIAIPDEPDVTDEDVMKSIREAYVKFNTEKTQCNVAIRDIEKHLKLMENTAVTLNNTYTSIVNGAFAKVDLKKLRSDQVDHYNKFKTELGNWNMYITKTYPVNMSKIRRKIETAINDIRVVFDEVTNRYNHVIKLQEGYSARMLTEYEKIILQIKNYTDEANAYDLKLSSIQVDMNRQFEDVCKGTIREITVINTDQMTILRNNYIAMNRAIDTWNTVQLQQYLRMLDELDLKFNRLSNERKRLIDAINVSITNQRDRDLFINNLIVLQNAITTLSPKAVFVSDEVKKCMVNAKQTLKASVNKTEYVWNMQLNYKSYVDSLITPFITENKTVVECIESKVLKSIIFPSVGKMNTDVIIEECKHYDRYIKQVSMTTSKYIEMLQDLQQEITTHQIKKYVELVDFKLLVDRNAIISANIVQKIIPLLTSSLPHIDTFKTFESDVIRYKNALEVVVKEYKEFKIEWKTCLDNLKMNMDAKFHLKLRDAHITFKSLFSKIHNMKDNANEIVAHAHWINFVDDIWDAQHQQQTKPFIDLYESIINTLIPSLNSEIKNGLDVIDQLNSHIKDMLVQIKILSVIDEIKTNLDTIKHKYNNLTQFWNQHKHEYEKVRESSAKAAQNLTLTYSTLTRTVDNTTDKIKEIEIHISLLNQTISNAMKIQNDILIPLSEMNDEAASMADRTMLHLETVKHEIPRVDIFAKTISDARIFLESISPLPESRGDGRTTSVIRKAKRANSITEAEGVEVVSTSAAVHVPSKKKKLPSIQSIVSPPSTTVTPSPSTIVTSPSSASSSSSSIRPISDPTISTTVVYPDSPTPDVVLTDKKETKNVYPSRHRRDMKVSKTNRDDRQSRLKPYDADYSVRKVTFFLKKRKKRRMVNQL